MEQKNIGTNMQLFINTKNRADTSKLRCIDKAILELN